MAEICHQHVLCSVPGGPGPRRTKHPGYEGPADGGAMTMIQLMRQIARSNHTTNTQQSHGNMSPLSHAHRGETRPHPPHPFTQLAPTHRMAEAGSVTIATVQARGKPKRANERYTTQYRRGERDYLLLSLHRADTVAATCTSGMYCCTQHCQELCGHMF